MSKITLGGIFSRIYLQQIFRREGVRLLAYSVFDSKLSEDKRRIRKSKTRSTPTTIKLRKIISI